MEKNSALYVLECLHLHTPHIHLYSDFFICIYVFKKLPAINHLYHVSVPQLLPSSIPCFEYKSGNCKENEYSTHNTISNH